MRRKRILLLLVYVLSTSLVMSLWITMLVERVIELHPWTVARTWSPFWTGAALVWFGALAAALGHCWYKGWLAFWWLCGELDAGVGKRSGSDVGYTELSTIPV